jgi:magnesium-transporting ATPase (P-type)
VLWVGVLIAILTLGGYIFGFVTHDMDPFADTLGLETFDREALVELVGEHESVPDNWDALTSEEREAVILGNEAGSEGEFKEEVSSGILGEAERVPRTIAFTVLAFTQMFEVMAIHAGDRLSFIKVRFKTNRWLFWAVLSTFILQLLVIYVPVLQVTLDTAPLSLTELVVASILGAVVLVAVEIEKALMRRGATHQSA